MFPLFKNILNLNSIVEEKSEVFWKYFEKDLTHVSIKKRQKKIDATSQIHMKNTWWNTKNAYRLHKQILCLLLKHA